MDYVGAYNNALATANYLKSRGFGFSEFASHGDSVVITDGKDVLFFDIRPERKGE
jgi:hypothetical protein